MALPCRGGFDHQQMSAMAVLNATRTAKPLTDKAVMLYLTACSPAPFPHQAVVLLAMVVRRYDFVEDPQRPVTDVKSGEAAADPQGATDALLSAWERGCTLECSASQTDGRAWRGGAGSCTKVSLYARGRD